MKTLVPLVMLVFTTLTACTPDAPPTTQTQAAQTQAAQTHSAQAPIEQHIHYHNHYYGNEKPSEVQKQQNEGRAEAQAELRQNEAHAISTQQQAKQKFKPESKLKTKQKGQPKPAQTANSTQANDLSRFDDEFKKAFQNKKHNLQLKGGGKVIKILPDDNKGSRHQRFIVKLNSGQTLLVAHNIDLAPKITSLEKGDYVNFYGEYEWTNQGGVMHWTHHDPAGRHQDGWLEHQGRRYQ